jgi:capsular exopolysaccharide synthesis family protein
MSRISDAMKRAGAADPGSFGDAGAGPVGLAGVSDYIRPPAEEFEAPPEVVPEELLVAGAPEPVKTGVPSRTGLAQPTEILEAASAKLELKLVANPALQPLAIEQYRRLAAIMHHTQEARGIRRVLIASAMAEEGKTLTAINLALTLSQSFGRRVLLVDADMRRPGVSHVFGLAPSGGLGDALYNPNPGKLTLVQLSDKLSVLPAGHAMRDPMAGLSSPMLGAILEEAGEAFDWVIVDSPPIGVMSDAKLLAATVDAAILVVAAGRTPFASLQRATDAIGRDRLLGVVLNRVDETLAAPGHYAYYHYYGQTPRNGHGEKRSWFHRLTGRK